MRLTSFLLLLFYKISFSQFTSGNVYVNSSCNYQIQGDYYDTSTTPLPLNLEFDSVLSGYKIVVPITTDSIRICVYPISCVCDSQCQTIIGTSNILLNFNICVITDVDELESFEKIYPNPFNDIIFLKSNGRYILTIYDNHGNIIEEKNIENETTYNTESLNNGLYLFVIRNRKSVKRFRMTKIR